MAYSKKTFTECEFNGYTVKPLKDEAKEQKEKKLQWSEKASDKPEDNLHRAQNNLYVLVYNYLNPPLFTWIKKINRNHAIGAGSLLEYLNNEESENTPEEQYCKLLHEVKNVRSELLAKSETNLDGEFINRLDTFLMRELFIDPTKKINVKLRPNAKPNEPDYFSVDRQIDAEITLRLMLEKENIENKKIDNSLIAQPYLAEIDDTLPSHSERKSVSHTGNDSEEDLLLNSSMQEDDEPNIAQLAAVSDQQKTEEKQKLELRNADFVEIKNDDAKADLKSDLLILFEILKEKYPTHIIDVKITFFQKTLAAIPQTKGKLLEQTNACLACALSKPTSDYSRHLAHELTVFLQQQLAIDHAKFKSSRQIDAVISHKIKSILARETPTPSQIPNL